MDSGDGFERKGTVVVTSTIPTWWHAAHGVPAKMGNFLQRMSC